MLTKVINYHPGTKKSWKALADLRILKGDWGLPFFQSGQSEGGKTWAELDQTKVVQHLRAAMMRFQRGQMYDKGREKWWLHFRLDKFKRDGGKNG